MPPTKKVFIENLGSYQTNFTGSTGSFKLMAHGYEDSIAQVNEDVADEPYVQRAVARGKLQVLTKAEATARILELDKIQNESSDDLSEYLEEGADHITDHFKKDLPDEAWATGPGWSAREILAGKKTEALKTVSERAKRQSASEAVEGGARPSSETLDTDTLTAMAQMGRSPNA